MLSAGRRSAHRLALKADEEHQAGAVLGQFDLLRPGDADGDQRSEKEANGQRAAQAEGGEGAKKNSAEARCEPPRCRIMSPPVPLGRHPEPEFSWVTFLLHQAHPT